MYRALRNGILLGALALGAGCENQTGAPAESTFIPRPQYVSIETASPMLTTRLAGYAMDPEAWFLSIATCKAPGCPFPPFLLDNSPLFYRSVVIGAPFSLMDPTATPAAVTPLVASEPTGTFTLPAVPSRKEPYLPYAPAGQGVLNPTPLWPDLPPIPPANYLPTISLRPIEAVTGDCWAIEGDVIGDNGIVQAVAKFLTTKAGSLITVADLMDPSKYGGVFIFWNYFPGFVYSRIPADGTTLEATAGQVINVEWAPPGVLPPPVADALQSVRGFFVNEAAPVSSLGLTAVVMPANVDLTQEVEFRPKDPGKDAPTNAALLRPWIHAPYHLRPMPGHVVFTTVLFDHSVGSYTKHTPITNCVPKAK